MKILFFADIVGTAGRLAVKDALPMWRDKHKPDFIVANAENSAHGDGVTPKILDELTAIGVEAFTMGDHFMGTDFSKVTEYPIVRPGNLVGEYPGVGVRVVENHLHRKLKLVNILGNAFMGRIEVQNFFKYADQVLAADEKADVVLVDFHAEATSEKNALGQYLDGKVSAVVGTHTHIPTADSRILPKGTAYQTDVGMCAALDSVIGFQTEDSYRFLRREMGEDVPKPTGDPADNPPFFCDAVLIETDGPTRAKGIQRLTTRPR